MIKEQVYGRYTFAAWTTPDEKEEILKRFAKFRTVGLDGAKHGEVPGLGEELKFCRDRLQNKLLELGIQDPESIMPDNDLDVGIYLYKSGQQGIEGNNFFPSHGFDIFMPPDIAFPNSDFRRVYFHEGSHFLRKLVVAKSKPPYGGGRTFGAGLFNPRKSDVYEEGNADIFALFCSEEETEISTQYPKEVSFLTSMLLKVAQAQGVEPVQVYRRFAQANITRDFSIYKDLVAVFGIQTVRGFNNFWWEDTNQWNQDYELEIKDEERKLFGEEFCKTHASYFAGEAISFPGIKGGFRRR